MPSTTSSVVSMVRDSSTVITPSLPTFFMASAMMPPICLSLLADMVPTCAIMSPLTSRESFLISSTATSTARSMPRLRAVGLAPAATVLTPSRKMACASTVAVVVPSPATSEVLEATSRTICAPMFSSGSRSSISLATVTPSLVMIGAPNFFSITALRPLGPSVIFTASARAFTPRKIAWREFSPVTICFAILVIPPDILFCELRNPDENCTGLKTGHYNGNYLLPGGLRCAAQLRQNFFFAKNEKLFILDFDFGTAVLAEQDTVARLDVERDQLALFALAGADGDDFAFHRLFFCGVRDDDAAPDAFLLFNAPHDDTVVERGKIHCHLEKPPLGELAVCSLEARQRKLALLASDCQYIRKPCHVKRLPDSSDGCLWISRASKPCIWSRLDGARKI